MLSAEERRRRNKLRNEKEEKKAQKTPYKRKYEKSTRNVVEDSFDVKNYIYTAKELCYPPAVIEALKKCKSHNEASIVMTGARKGEFD